MPEAINEKKVIFSGIQPTGVMHIGNYIGAVKNWVKLQDEYTCLYCAVDLHAITVRQDPAKLRRSSLEMIALLLACGLNPEKNIIFLQSHVPSHAELAWVLSCYSMFGELGRMTQFKDKSARNAENINAGLFTYPVLMAADILLYGTHLVPVGDDQKQHLELARNIAERFNGVYGDVFTVPEPYIKEAGARIMSLADPSKKMSKSDENPNGYVALLDSPDEIVRKFKRAVTDSESGVRMAEGRDGLNNLITIYCEITGRTPAETEREFEGRGYGDFKLALGETVADALKPVRDEFARLMGNKDALAAVYKSGAEKAYGMSRRMLGKVYRKVGFADR